MKAHARRLFPGLLSVLALAATARAEDVAPAPPAPPAQEAEAGVPDPAPQGEELPFAGAWGGVQYLTAPGPGYTDGYTLLEGFVPAYQSEWGLFFGDVRGILDDDGLVSANVGGGYRYYSAPGDRIWGANVFWDYRDAGSHTFDQVGFGFESLGRLVDFRTNVYLVVGADQKNSFTFLANPQFVGHGIQVDRVLTGQAAMSGFDAEVGVPISCDWGLKAYVGTYNYQVEDSPQAWGVKARLEERLTDNLDMSLSYTNDRVFGNTVAFEVGYRFGGRCSREGSSHCNTWSRMSDRVERNDQIAVIDQTLVQKQPLTDPTTGQPIVVENVEAGAAPGGDGSFEHPFQTLAQLQAGSGPGQILFVQNGAYTGAITLKSGQRLLGDGITHQVVSQQGTFNLPILQAGATPTINGTVVLAANTEVSGLRFLPPGTANAIFGSGLAGSVDINRNTSVGGRTAVALDHITGPLTITGNRFSNSTAGSDEIVLNHITGPVFVSNNAFANSGKQGAVLLNITGPVTFTGNTISNSASNGVNLGSINGALLFSNNTITNSGGFGALLNTGSTVPTWSVLNNSIANATPSGMLIDTSAGGSLSANVIGNTSTGSSQPFTFFQGAGSNLKFFFSNNTGALSNFGATQVFTPFQ